MMYKHPVLLFLVLFLLLASCQSPPVCEFDDSPINALKDPLQKKIKDKDPIELKEGDHLCSIRFFTEYSVSAMVVHKKYYHDGIRAEFSPLDLALAWGKMITPEYDQHMKYRQSNRWYYYRYDASTPFSKKYIINHSSNHHIIPANQNIAKALKTLNTKEIVRLDGYLVSMKIMKGKKVVFRYKSSLRRLDSGANSCELMYVEKVQKGKELFR